MKKCIKCEEAKPLEDFYRHSQMGDGYTGKCKACTRRATSDRHARMSQNPEWVESELERHRQKSRKARALGKASPVTLGANKSWRERNDEKRTAHGKVAYALRTGKINRMPCEKCGDQCSEAHHDDYSKPLDVRWLCSTHHAEHHVEMRRIARLAKLRQSSAV